VGFFGDARAGGLFVQILDWMMRPLIILWPAAVLGSWLAAVTIADNTYDLRLRDIVHALAEEVRTHAAEADGTRRLPVFKAFRDDPVDRFYVQLLRPGGERIEGDEDIPPPGPSDPPAEAAVRFRDVTLAGASVRLAYQLVTMPTTGQGYVVQVGEPIQRRRGLVSNVTAIVMVVIALLVPATVAMVWLGLRHGLSPLLRLRELVERRAPDDLSPIAPGDVPLEIEPLINTLNRQLERVRANLDAQRRFVDDAAHQMRTPLAGLKTQAQAAARAESLEHTRERLARIEESADRLAHLMEQLLALARADGALARPAPQEVCELNAVLHDVCAQAADRALAKGLALAFDAAPSAANVRGDAVLLREMFANIVDNAIRYTPRGGEVDVRVNPGPPFAVSVQDSGVGIVPADRERVFDRFHRVLGTGESGSGLGLAIVKAIADWHGAHVRVEPSPGDVGARFVVTFPA
jgi:two-component system sensor histidine kinase TctE